MFNNMAKFGLFSFVLASVISHPFAMPSQPPLAIEWHGPAMTGRGGREFLANLQRLQREAMLVAEERERLEQQRPSDVPDNPFGPRPSRRDRRMFKMLPPTVIASNICPYWFLQMQCTSMKDNPKPKEAYCPMIHPEFIDYDVADLPEAIQWCFDPDDTRGQLQWMVNVQRCRFKARNGWCRWGNACDKGHCSQAEMANRLWTRHPHSAGLVFITRSGLFYSRRLSDEDIQADIEEGDEVMVPMETTTAHTWTKLLRFWNMARHATEAVSTVINRYHTKKGTQGSS